MFTILKIITKKILFYCLFIFISVYQVSGYEIKNLSYETGQDKISSFVSTKIPGKIIVKIHDDFKKPVRDIPVYFSLVSKPSKAEGQTIEDTFVLTGSNGIASTNFITGNKTGNYNIIVTSPQIPEKIVSIKIEAKKKLWGLELLFGLLGGLALFLYGMKLMGDSLIKLGGTKMSKIMNVLTSNRFMGVFVGTFVTLVVQSSSATTVMVVGLINAQMMSLAQSIGIILGANIGTTITAQIIAFKLTDYSLLFIAIGFSLMLLSKNKKKIIIGEIILGFGILFYGIDIMSRVMEPIRSYQPFIQMMQQMENPLKGVIVGFVFTALIQSSSAATGVFIALSFQGLLTLKGAIPLTFGANIGTCATAILASLNANREAKRAALAHILFNIISTVIFLPFLDWYQKIIEYISYSNHISAVSTEDIITYVPRQIANAHSIAKIIAVILFLPLTNHLARLCEKLMPVKPEKDADKYKPKYLDKSAMMLPTVALQSAKQEILRMAFSVKKMLDLSIETIEKRNEETIDTVINIDNKIDSLNHSIRDYLVKIAQNPLSPEDSKSQMSFMYLISNIEHIGDIISHDIMNLSRKLINKNISLPAEEYKTILDQHKFISENFTILFESFKDGHENMSEKIIKNKNELIKNENEMRRLHFININNKPQGITPIYLDLIQAYHSVYSGLSSCAYIMKGEF
ncbi:Na/Pi symporter [Candidatus Dependentiae bacterium]|nr:Na/Pi symporter [Candidatus Dependentiae bacterium]